MSLKGKLDFRDLPVLCSGVRVADLQAAQSPAVLRGAHHSLLVLLQQNQLAEEWLLALQLAQIAHDRCGDPGILAVCIQRCCVLR